MATREEAWAAFERARAEAHEAAREYFYGGSGDRVDVRRVYHEKMQAFIEAEAALRRIEPALVERW